MLQRKHQTLVLRSNLLQAIRTFFCERGFIEVQTPVRICHPALEDYIDAIPSGDMWLRTSPELHMKRLIASGMERIFQIGPCFRADEHGSRHRCEFTMLEWYQAHADYRELMTFTQDLIIHCANAIGAPCPASWQKLTVENAFRQFAGVSAEQACMTNTFDEILTETVEPALGDDAVFLIDYPAALGALARLSPSNSKIAERWELYMNGLEIANTYSELIDPVEQRQRFEKTAALRASDGREVYPLDEAFMTALSEMPPCAGSALGVDRLLMALLESQDIEDVTSFTEDARERR